MKNIMTRTQFEQRLRKARKENRILAEKGKLSDPTKPWSEDSMASLMESLSGSAEVVYGYVTSKKNRI